MLLFNARYNIMDDKYEHFNTSNVTIQLNCENTNIQTVKFQYI